MNPPPPSPPPLPINDDLLCMHCRYNLRTRSAADRCPECGLAIARTLAHLRESAGILIDRRAFCSGSLLFSGLCIAGAVLYAGEALLDSPLSRQLGPEWFTTINPLVVNLAYLLFLAATVAGLALVSAGVSARIISAGARSFMFIITIILAVLTAPQALSAIGFLLRRPRFIRPGFFAARELQIIAEHRLALALICTLLLAVGFVCLRRLGRALASEHLQRCTTILFPIMLAQALLPVVILAIIVHRGGRRALFGASPSLFLAPDFFSAICTALFAWYWWTLARMLRDQTPAPSAAPLPPNPTPLPEPGHAAPRKLTDFLARRRP